MVSGYVTAVVDQRYTDAAKVLDASIASCRPDDKHTLAQLLLNRGYCSHRVQLYRKALKDYDAALDAIPRQPLALYRKGQVLAAQKKIEDARAVWEEALRACDERTDIQLLLDISAALRDPHGVKVGPEPPPGRTGRTGRSLLLSGGREALRSGMHLACLALLLLLLAGQRQQTALLRKAGLSAVVGPATPHHSDLAAAATRPAAAAAGSAACSTHAAQSSSLSPASLANGSAAAAASPSAPADRGAAAPAGASRPSTPAAQNGTSSSAAAAAGATGAVGKLAPSPAAAAPSGKATRPAAAAASSSAGSGGRGAASAASAADGTCEAVEEVDCVAQQRAARGAAAGASSSSSSSGVGGADAQQSLNNSIAIQVAVTQINGGQIAEAEAILDKLLASSPKELGARVARGTARALRRDLKGAVEDFSVAIEVEPRYADSWKRRGQARSALGQLEGALADLQKAIDLAPLFGGVDSATSRAECFVERGMIFQKQRDYRRACRELRSAVRLDPENSAAWNVLGLCATSQGDIRDGVAAYEKAVELNPRLKESWVNMGQALKEEGRTKEAERVLLKALSLDPPEAPSVHVLRVLAQMKQQQGQHAAAVRLLDKALPYAEARDEQVVEVLYLRAICHHALGAFREAVRDYEDCIGRIPKAGLSSLGEETRQFQFLSFYQKDIALFTHHSLDRRAADFCPDSELPAVFKELWCKKGPPTAELIAQYPPQPPLPPSPPPLPPGPDPVRLRALTAPADALGVLLQNNHQGFLPNVRQQRAAGYAAIELGQTLLAAVAARRGGRQQWVRSEGSSGQAGGAGRHLFGWRDAMDIVVKWRQLAEPNDQVVWVDLLTRREFEAGFGSHTPMFSGQTKCVRYYMNFARALDLQREVLLREGHAFDAANRAIPVGSEAQREAIRGARTAEDMYNVIQQDSWVVVPIQSVARAGRSLEGTRLTLVRVPNQPDAYEFSIRTPVTPPRWRDFDAELEAAFEGILTAFVEGDLPQLAARILTYCYYWYNFMPLARGTAAVGYTTMLSLFWAAGMPVTASIPKDYQVDWEAILAQHPDQFIASVSAWLYPPQARGLPCSGVEDGGSSSSSSKAAFPPMDSLPPVSEVLGTIRQRLIALNGEGAKRYV